MSKFLYRSFNHAKLAAQWLCDYINENGGNATCQVYDSSASGQIVNITKWNNIENSNVTFYGSDITVFVRNEIDNEAIFSFRTNAIAYNNSNSIFSYFIHLSNGVVYTVGGSSTYVTSVFPIPVCKYLKNDTLNISKMVCMNSKNSTVTEPVLSIADRDLYTADALIDTGVIYTDALGNKFIGAAPFILCKYDE